MSAEKFSELLVDRALERARVYGLCDAMLDALWLGFEDDLAEFEKDLTSILEGKSKDEVINLFVGYFKNE
jgi:hypothetical protein